MTLSILGFYLVNLLCCSRLPSLRFQKAIRDGKPLGNYWIHIEIVIYSFVITTLFRTQNTAVPHMYITYFPSVMHWFIKSV